MKNKLAIFDMDGTLFDTKEANFMAYKTVLEDYDYNLEYEYFIKNCFGKYYKDFLNGIVDEKLFEEVHNKKKKLYRDYLDYIKENKELFNIIKLLKTEYYIALVTTASKQNTEDLLLHYDKVNLFDLVLTHNDIEKSKPDPEGFNKAIKHFNVSSEDTIIFEDSETGIEAARKTGATVLVVDKF